MIKYILSTNNKAKIKKMTRDTTRYSVMCKPVISLVYLVSGHGMVFQFSDVITTGELLFPRVNSTRASCASFSVVRESSGVRGRMIIYDHHIKGNTSTISSIIDFEHIPVLDESVDALVIDTDIEEALHSKIISVHGSNGFIQIFNLSLINTSCPGKTCNLLIIFNYDHLDILHIALLLRDKLKVAWYIFHNNFRQSLDVQYDSIT